MKDANILKNKNCLVTGATAGIGKAIALELASNGCNLFLTGRNSKRLENLKKKIEKEDTDLKVRICIADLSKRSEIKKVIKKVRSSFSNIDILVNSANNYSQKSFEKSTLTDLDQILDIDVKVPYMLTKEFSREMESNQWGRIVNIGSESSYVGFSKRSMYCLAKHALLGFSRSINEELKYKGIRVFCISPGPTKTKMGKSILKKDSPNENFNTFIEPDDIAKLIISTICYNKSMVSNEIRLNRMESY